MKKFLLIFLIVIILALDWAALDDITTGNEPNYYGEYVILLVSLIFFSYAGFSIVRNRFKSR